MERGAETTQEEILRGIRGELICIREEIRIFKSTISILAGIEIGVIVYLLYHLLN